MKKYLTTFDSFVLYTTSVLGLGLIVLPSIAARQVGNWSILVWLALGVLSFPMARVMGQLGSEYPSAGGVTEFIRVAFGKHVANCTAALYLVAMLFGPPATGLFFAEYFSVIVPIGKEMQILMAGAFLLFLVSLNCINVETTSLIQRGVFVIFLALAIIGIMVSMPYIEQERLTASSSVSTGEILAISYLCFHAFIGWEHASFSSEEMKDSRSMVTAVFAAVVVVTVIFVLLAIAVVGAVPPDELRLTNTSLTSLFKVSFGDASAKITAAVAVLIIFMMMLTWARGGGRLLYSVARRANIPVVGAIHEKTGAPRGALLVLMAGWIVSLFCFWYFNQSVEDYLLLANANYILTYVVIYVAAAKILLPRKLLWAETVIALVASVGLLLIGFKVLWLPMVTITIYIVTQLVLTVAPARQG